MKIGVVGGGSWGTALAKLLTGAGHEVTLWCRDRGLAIEISSRHENSRYLPGVHLPATLRATDDLGNALGGAEMVLAVTPSHAMREVLRHARAVVPPGAILVSASKGVEDRTFDTMSAVLAETLPGHR